ncbi:MAG TPA: NYN domain-containing protein [Thermomicrobiales bacterium]|nr:NYN domain-containing protein [Thermomicrobiales bacterium]
MSPTQNGKSREDAETDQQNDVALLIDYENLQVSLKRHFNLTTPKMSLIIQEAQEYGRLVLARAYAPWTSPDLSIDAENLYRQGIDLIYVPTGKNSADVRMAVDAVDLTSRVGNLRTILFVTGDGDLIHPLNYLRQQGRKVVVIGVDAAMSRMLSSAADSVLIYERDLDPSVRRRATRAQGGRRTATAPAPAEDTKQEPEPEPEPQPRLTPLKNNPPAEEAFRLLQDVLQRHGSGEPLLYQEIGHWLWREHNFKSRTWYGVPFSVFMDAAQEAGYVALATSGGNSYAALPSSDQLLEDSDSDDDEDTTESDTGAVVRLESLQPEERQMLFDALRELRDDPRLKYFTFRTILRRLVSTSALPRLNETQVRSLLNDLANREPPILIRSTKRGRNPSGGTYTFASFTLTPDESLLQVHGERDQAAAEAVDAAS